MKRFLLIVITILTTISCSSKKYLLADENSENKRLVELIQKLKKEGEIDNNPVIVINEIVINKEEVKNLDIRNSDIINISTISKNNQQMVDFYGENAINGVILIEAKPVETKTSKSLAESKVLYFVDGKKRNARVIKKINPDDIETITVIKNKDDILKYTTKDYNGVILIILKKQITNNN